jgi:hypothetical protein
MAREDELLKSFMAHEILKEKYNIDEAELPKTIEEGMKSKHPIIVAITNIVKGVQKAPASTDNEIASQLFQILNRTAV